MSIFTIDCRVEGIIQLSRFERIHDGRGTIHEWNWDDWKIGHESSSKYSIESRSDKNKEACGHQNRGHGIEDSRFLIN